MFTAAQSQSVTRKIVDVYWMSKLLTRSKRGNARLLECLPHSTMVPTGSRTLPRSKPVCEPTSMSLNRFGAPYSGPRAIWRQPDRERRSASQVDRASCTHPSTRSSGRRPELFRRSTNEPTHRPTHRHWCVTSLSFSWMFSLWFSLFVLVTISYVSFRSSYY